MRLRFVLAALSAVLAPLGAEGEVWSPERETVAEATGPAGSWIGGAFGRTERWKPPSRTPDVDGPTDRDSVEGWPLWAVVGDTSCRPPRGLASLDVTSRAHLLRSGHAATRLDLPPPPRG